MASKPIDDEQDDTLDLTEDMELDETDQDGGQGEDDSGGDGDGAGDGEEETFVAFADETEDAEQAGDSSVIRNLRQQLRDHKRRVAELEKATAKPKIEIGPEPELADYGYDEEAYKAGYREWLARSEEAKAASVEAEEGARKANESWQRDLSAYEQRKGGLGVADFEEAESTVKAHLSLVQQAVIVKSAQDPAAFIYALGGSEAKLAELAKFEDPIKMAAAVARMEGGIKVLKRRKAPEPDRPANGSARMPGGADKKLEELEKKADRTGDRTELLRYRKQAAERGKKGGK